MSDASSRTRPRLSLLSLLLVTTLVGTSISTWMLWREVGPLRAEVRRYRDEFGFLTIDDPTKLHAIRLRTEEVDGYAWAWRVYVPAGKVAELTTRHEHPSSTTDAPIGGTGHRTLAEGEHVLRVLLIPGSDDKYVLRV